MCPCGTALRPFLKIEATPQVDLGIPTSVQHRMLVYLGVWGVMPRCLGIQMLVLGDRGSFRDRMITFTFVVAFIRYISSTWQVHVDKLISSVHAQRCVQVGTKHEVLGASWATAHAMCMTRTCARTTRVYKQHTSGCGLCRLLHVFLWCAFGSAVLRKCYCLGAPKALTSPVIVKL